MSDGSNFMNDRNAVANRLAMADTDSMPIKEPPFGTAGGLYYPSDGAHELARYLGLDAAGLDALHTELRECYVRAKREGEDRADNAADQPNQEGERTYVQVGNPEDETRRWYRESNSMELFTDVSLSRGEIEWIVRACWPEDGDDPIAAIVDLSGDIQDLVVGLNGGAE